jgi:hypothetical protein
MSVNCRFMAYDTGHKGLMPGVIAATTVQSRTPNVACTPKMLMNSRCTPAHVLVLHVEFISVFGVFSIHSICTRHYAHADYGPASRWRALQNTNSSTQLCEKPIGPTPSRSSRGTAFLSVFSLQHSTRSATVTREALCSRTLQSLFDPSESRVLSRVLFIVR